MLKQSYFFLFKFKMPLSFTNLFSFHASLLCFSWIRWQQYRSENTRFQQIEAKYKVDKTIIQELNPQLSITLSSYEKLTEQLGKEETLEYFKEETDKLSKRKN